MRDDQTNLVRLNLQEQRSMRDVFKVRSVFNYGCHSAAVVNWCICPEYLHLLANLKCCYGVSFTPVYT